ncbi:M3 family metallopeptidase [Saccharospirillum impatiens]|uniref:M3 family metallopeptidase n=1 Tax=Saccharospirillum impatiens TaxID=169438 RepID=UPI0003FF0C3B|nr:M3 family metallopeptidase [Saccharospirillum impatiens]
MQAPERQPASPTFAQWDLSLAINVLSRFEDHWQRVQLEHKIESARRALERFPVDATQITRLHNGVMEIDRILDSIQGACNVIELTLGDSVRTDNEIRDWHSRQCKTYSQVIEGYMSAIERRLEHVPTIIREWYDSISALAPAPEPQEYYTTIADYYTTNQNKAFNALSQRAFIDPDLKALAHRLYENRLSKEEADFTSVHQEESQAYFRQLASCTSINRPSLFHIRDLEESRYASFTYSLTEALHVLRHSFSQCHPNCAFEIDRIVAQGRLRLVDGTDQPDLCLDTPFGSYVQLQFNSSLPSVVSLAHELGHAVHQHLHRNSYRASHPLNAVDSETWALDFETVLIDRLTIDHPDFSPVLNAYRESRRIEINHRHRMLHRFELALHNPSIQSPEDVNTLWLNVNRLFYGDSIKLEADFKHAWQEVHHLFTAPFYLMVYGIAKERADTNRPTQSINQRYPTKEH